MAYKDYRDIIRQMERDMQQISDEVFRGFFDLPSGGGRFWHPPADVYENDSAILVKMELAGVRPEDIQVMLSADDLVLTIKGVRKEPEGQRNGRLRCHQLEIYFGPFERAIALPHGVPIERDQITANYKNGFLLVILPKKAVVNKPQTRVIPITAGESTTEGDQNLELEEAAAVTQGSKDNE
jgi:HSP20 family protein